MQNLILIVLVFPLKMKMGYRMLQDILSDLWDVTKRQELQDRLSKFADVKEINYD